MGPLRTQWFAACTRAFDCRACVSSTRYANLTLTLTLTLTVEKVRYVYTFINSYIKYTIYKPLEVIVLLQTGIPVYYLLPEKPSHKKINHRHI